jgi:NADH:ubiquinone oxidoreductase subunit 3 (subunit A)
MIGPILVFVGVCALVAIYMAIVRSFLRESERADQPGEETKAKQPYQSQSIQSRPAQWAH